MKASEILFKVMEKAEELSELGEQLDRALVETSDRLGEKIHALSVLIGRAVEALRAYEYDEALAHLKQAQEVAQRPPEENTEFP